ncbi:MAG: tRNA(Ile)-lysidine synthase [Verrucomicrobiae bacterium]|nr:tRNA(Ile)-lysidine synthase [Verrucomicrobiae bacterium]
MAALPARFLVGVSGGADSVALLDALVRLGHRPHVCHLNHKLRGAESDGDAEFVRKLAGQYGLPVTIKSRRVKADENACRQARLAFFEQVAKKTGITTIALAHTGDDQVETFLMRLIRGAGVDGLAGIWPERQMGKLRVIRPLLNVSHADVMDYLKRYRLKWREDSSNANRRFLRNRIRHELLPLLEREYNAGIRAALRRTAEILRAEAEADPVAMERRTIRGLSFEQVEELRRLAAKTPPAGKRTLEEKFDGDLLGGKLTVRTWRAGDRFRPLGMKGEKKLQDFFVDAKVPRGERGRVPLVCAADGRIAWVVGYRMSDAFKVSAQTKRVLRIRFEGC